MPSQREILLGGGAALLAFGGLLWLDRGTAASPSGSSGTSGSGTKPPPTPPPGPPPPQVISCVKSGSAKIIVNSWFYNWSDLRKLPLSARDQAARHTWWTGGGTAELGWPIGHPVSWTEAKRGIASDGRSGWFVRVDGGDWALPAADLGVANPCG